MLATSHLLPATFPTLLIRIDLASEQGMAGLGFGDEGGAEVGWLCWGGCEGVARALIPLLPDLDVELGGRLSGFDLEVAKPVELVVDGGDWAIGC